MAKTKKAAKPKIEFDVSARQLLSGIIVLMALVFGGFATISLNATLFDKIPTLGTPLSLIFGILVGAAGVTIVAVATINACSEIFAFLLPPDQTSSFRYLLSLLQHHRAGSFVVAEKGELKVIPQPSGSRASGSVQVAHGSAVVTQRRGEYSQVLTKGFHELMPFETCLAALDLTLQQMEKEVDLYTRDGIKVHTRVRVQFQIHSGGRTPTPADMYPVLEHAVVNAVYAVPDWKVHTIESAVVLLRAMIAECYLNQIYDPTHSLAQSKSSGTQLEDLQQQAHARLAENSFRWGVKINSLVVEITPPKEIEIQALAFEEAQSENQRIKEFTEATGGSPADYAYLQLCKSVGKTGVTTQAIEKLAPAKTQKAG